MSEKKQRGEGQIRRHGSHLQLRFYKHGRRIEESTKFEDTEVGHKKAAKLLRKRLGEVAAGVHRDSLSLRYEDLRDSFMADYVTNGRKSLRRNREGKPYLDKVARLDSFFAGWRASEIDADLIRKFVADQQGRGLANGTINRSVSALRRMFNLALEDDKLRQLPHFPMVKEAAPRQGFFEREDYDNLSANLPDYLRLPLAIGFFTGMRLGEILGLEWAQVDLVGSTIELRAGETKNDAARTVPVVPQLRTLLVEQHARRYDGCPCVCFRLDHKGRAVRIRGFRKAWYAACIKSGLGTMQPIRDEAGNPLYEKARGIRSKPKVKTAYQGRLFHDLRRSGVRNLVRAGVPEGIAMQISGHKTRSVFERYNITSKRDIADAGRKLAEFHFQKVGDKAGTESTEMQQQDSSVN